jgi:hypothetical protein
MTPTPRTLTVSERLLARLRAEGVKLGPRTTMVRVRASTEARAAGAWSWQALDPDNLRYGVGSQWPMAECVQAARLTITKDANGDVQVDPA